MKKGQRKYVQRTPNNVGMPKKTRDCQNGMGLISSVTPSLMVAQAFAPVMGRIPLKTYHIMKIMNDVVHHRLRLTRK